MIRDVGNISAGRQSGSGNWPASGIGEATVRTFSEAGTHVLVVDVDDRRANELARSIENTEPKHCDITNEAEVRVPFTRLEQLDALVNCAGTVWSGASNRQITQPRFAPIALRRERSIRPFVEAYLEKYHRYEKDKVRLELNERQPLGRFGAAGGDREARVIHLLGRCRFYEGVDSDD